MPNSPPSLLIFGKTKGKRTRQTTTKHTFINNIKKDNYGTME